MAFDKSAFISWATEYVDWHGLSDKTTEAFTGWSAKDPSIYFDKSKNVLSLLEEVVDLIEKFARDIDDLSSGKDKLELAVEAIDELVKFPFLLEWADGVIIRIMLTAIVQQKNKWFGKDWIKND